MINQKDLLVISIFTFITVIFWVVSGVYHAIVTSQITEVQEELITPLNPKLNAEAIENIRSRSNL
ncbi:TPA: hypothetical protein DIV55_02695 [Patescibacteria group bacterium]|uniref:Uncharacterized protein n=1 Tax=Candidatus Gottesmanbacteria bacterium GW2011_GWA1_43_11 TaxID=1618436 RepID=A0A0G1FC42_9BACT|nr:MAG: hypothetical protein UV59_C0019G0008 [Candidatus Gottesmanbacteria bacterium GW2011_GWA1_43_11]HCS78628.1 hypothetical protein [Patescibacteria group bacterium]